MTYIPMLTAHGRTVGSEHYPLRAFLGAGTEAITDGLPLHRRSAHRVTRGPTPALGTAHTRMWLRKQSGGTVAVLLGL